MFIFKKPALKRALPVAFLLAFAGRAWADDGDICFKESGDVAITACSRVINSKSSSIKDRTYAYNNRGQEWYIKENYDRAISDFDSAISLNPKGLLKFGDGAILARGNRANAYGAKGNMEISIAGYTDAIAIDPDFTAAYTGRGLKYEKLGEFDKANADFKMALSLKPKYQDGKWAIDTARKHLEQSKDDTPKGQGK